MIKNRPRMSFLTYCSIPKNWLLIVAVIASIVSIGILTDTRKASAQRSAPGIRFDEINAAVPAGANGAGDYVPGEVIVGFQPGSPRAGKNAIRSGIGAELKSDFAEIRAQHWKLPAGLTVERAIQVLSSNPNVRYAEPNYIVSTDAIPSDPNDTYRSDLWAMHNLGQSGGTTNADINAAEAWTVTQGSPNVVIGVIDTGIDFTHPDLAGNIWSNPGETGLDGNGFDRATNGIDDDGNGYIDDAHGWDFANNDNDPTDDNGHGSHVSGTIGASGNNGLGVVGVNWTVKILPLKFLGANGSGDNANAISAILYASKFKDSSGNNVVRMTSNSWGGGKRSSALQDAITNSGALFVAAAGNGATSQTQYPAGYSSANIISVAATDHNDQLASFSNYGSSWVDLAAPGVNIISTYRGGGYAMLSGTSMATPHVAGVAGLVLANTPSLSVSAIKSAILNSVDQKASLSGKVLTGGRLNAGRALGITSPIADNCASNCIPADVTDLTADTPTPTSLQLHWTATGDDGLAGSAYLYDVRFSTSPITAANFAQATVVNGEPVPQPALSAESFTVKGLRPQTTYYLAMRTSDEAGNYTGLATTTGTTSAAPWDVKVIEDGADNVGFYSSLSYDSSGMPAIGYSDETADSLKYTRWDGSGWATQIVDTTGRNGVSLAFDSSNVPTLTYGWGKLRYTQYVPSTQSWQITILESRNAYNDVTSNRFAPNGNPSVSYRTTTNSGSGYLKFARKGSSGWVIQSVDPAGARYNSLAYDLSGNPSIAYSDDADKDNTLDTLKFARWDGTKWNVQAVETGTPGFGVMASLAYDGSGNPAITHSVSGTIRFVRRVGSTWAPAEIIASGYYPSLIYDPLDGSFYVSYVQSDNTVKLARRDSSGTWTSESVDFGSTIRWLLPMAVSPCGTPSVAYSTSPNNDLRFATKCTLAP